jgi:hypothetical protein
MQQKPPDYYPRLEVQVFFEPFKSVRRLGFRTRTGLLVGLLVGVFVGVVVGALAGVLVGVLAGMLAGVLAGMLAGALAGAEIRGIGIKTGIIGFATHNYDPIDHDGLPEIYLDGETVRRGPFRRNDQCVVAELAEQPGRFGFQLTAFLPGISDNENDLAVARFLYFLRFHDTREFLRTNMKWDTPKGQTELKNTIREIILRDVQATVMDYLQVWTSFRIGDVADKLFVSLDTKLKPWGLSLTTGFIDQRWYPESLSKVALQFMAAERSLLETKGAKRDALLTRLSISPADLKNLETESERYGKGAGLFVQAQKNIVAFIEWLKLERAAEAAEYLERLYSGKYAPGDVALSENVLRSTFRYPMLGLGEWGIQQKLAEITGYHQLVDFLQRESSQG